MSSATPGACVPGMPGALIHDAEALRFKNGELLGDQFHGTHSCGAHSAYPAYAGMIFLNGFTVNLAYTPAATYGSASAHSRAASSDSNSARMRLPENPAGPGSGLSIAG